MFTNEFQDEMATLKLIFFIFLMPLWETETITAQDPTPVKFLAALNSINFGATLAENVKIPPKHSQLSNHDQHFSGSMV